jgi:glycosyltransferase involved in cell wall biosynthesis
MQPLVYSVLPRPPHPTRDGAAIRNFHLLQALSRRFRLRCFVLVAPHLAGEPGEYPEGAGVEPILQGDRRLRASASFARAAFSKDAYPMLLYRSPALLRRLRESASVEPPALVIGHGLHAGALALDAGLPLWIDLHNVESEIWQRMAATASSVARRLFAAWQAPRVVGAERRVLSGASGASCVSERDAAALCRISLGAAPEVVPNGVDLDHYAFRPGPAASERLFFVGDLSWAPNAEGVRWFARDVWSTLSKQRPGATVEILGRRAPADLVSLTGPRFVLAGEGGDTRPHWRQAAVGIVPLLAGGGTRLKILEAAACGVPVVSTSVGAEGLSFVEGEEILLRDEPGAFAEAVAGLLADAASRARMAEAARRRVEKDYGWAPIGDRFAEAVARKVPGS